MAIDSKRAARQAVLKILKADADVTALVVEASIYGQTSPPAPPRPFIRYGAATSTPLKAACLDGQQILTAVHVWAGPRMDGPVKLETGEDFADRIGAAVTAALDAQRVDIPGGHATIAVISDQMLQDDVTDHFHAVVNLRIRCMTSL